MIWYSSFQDIYTYSALILEKLPNHYMMSPNKFPSHLKVHVYNPIECTNANFKIIHCLPISCIFCQNENAPFLSLNTPNLIPLSKN